MESFVHELRANVVEHLRSILAKFRQDVSQLTKRALLFGQLHRTRWQRLEVAVDVIDQPIAKSSSSFRIKRKAHASNVLD